MIDPAGTERRASVVVPCSDLEAALAFYCGRLGFRVERISPADDPVLAQIVRDGLRLHLDRRAEVGLTPPTLRLEGEAGGTLEGPDGVRVVLVPAPKPLLPTLVPSLVVSKAGSRAAGLGRAGMIYRDLIPDRHGGRFIASHIAIEEAGVVADYVHYHQVRFQMIHCWRGWVRVVYEGQGDPFVLEAGDCVLQPPLIRHRVLESSAGLEVIEISSPAVHDTFGDLALDLPDRGNPAPKGTERTWAGQRFIRHVARDASWEPWGEGWVYRDTGIGAATAGFAAVIVARPSLGGDPTWKEPRVHGGELLFFFVIAGALSVECGTDLELSAGDSFSIPPGLPHRVTGASPDLEVLAVRV